MQIFAFNSGHKSISRLNSCNADLTETLSGYNFFTNSCFKIVLRFVMAGELGEKMNDEAMKTLEKASIESTYYVL